MAVDFDLSIIIQGPIEHGISVVTQLPITLSLCLSIKRLLPRAEVILSTWADEDVKGIPFDVLVQSHDPGPQGLLDGFVTNNVNRQIITTRAGLQTAGRKFAMKIRSDIELLGTEFLEKLPLIPRISGDEAIFSHKIIANNLSSRNARAVEKRMPGHWLLFHPSDHLHAGYTSDLSFLWDISLQSEQDATYYLNTFRPNKYRDNELSRLTPEQFVFISAMNKVRYVEFPHYASQNEELLKLSEKYLNTNFCHMPDRILPIRFQKYHTQHHFSYDWMRIPGDRFPAPSVFQSLGNLRGLFSGN